MTAEAAMESTPPEEPTCWDSTSHDGTCWRGPSETRQAPSQSYTRACMARLDHSQLATVSSHRLACKMDCNAKHWHVQRTSPVMMQCGTAGDADAGWSNRCPARPCLSGRAQTSGQGKPSIELQLLGSVFAVMT